MQCSVRETVELNSLGLRRENERDKVFLVPARQLTTVFR